METTDGGAKKGSVAGGILMGLLVLVSLCIALYGAWVATSLAVYHDGPVWLAIVGAVTCFFLLPLGWELLADRHQKGGRVRDAILRSAFLSITFITVLLVTHPASAFKALATRGDWFLGGSTSATSQSIRGVLHTLGDGLEGIYNLTREQIFDEDVEAAAIEPAPSPPVIASPVTSPDAPVPPRDTAPVVAVVAAEGLPIPGSTLRWPLPAKPHAALDALPDSAGVSIEALGKHFAATIPDLFERAKAVHDFVATTVSYDVPMLRAIQGGVAYPHISAQKVFEARASICEGYARLLIALGNASGLRVVRVAGSTRSVADYNGLPSFDADPVLPSLGHTWNAVEIAGRWYLLDATWNAGHLEGEKYVAEYSTAYLFTPPEVMALTHFPEEEKWQLRTPALSRSDWLRLPLVRPDFMAQRLALKSPLTPALSVGKTLSVAIDNPAGVALGMFFIDADGEQGSICSLSSEALATLTCDLAEKGRYTAHIAARLDPLSSTYRSLGAFVIDASP